jgi:hypothetical protein
VWEFGKRESVFGFGGGGGDLGECHIDSSVFQDSSRTTLTHLCKGNAELQTIIKLSITHKNFISSELLSWDSVNMPLLDHFSFISSFMFPV